MLKSLMLNVTLIIIEISIPHWSLGNFEIIIILGYFAQFDSDQILSILRFIH